MCRELPEREGFEPPVPRRHNGFQDRRFRPLSHLSKFLFMRCSIRKREILTLFLNRVYSYSLTPSFESACLFH